MEGRRGGGGEEEGVDGRRGEGEERRGGGVLVQYIIVVDVYVCMYSYTLRVQFLTVCSF